MNKKVVIILSAVIAFFAGAIWVSEVPVVATLVAFLEVCAGFGCGFFYNKLLTNESAVKSADEIQSLNATIKKLRSQLSSLQAEAKSTEVATKAVATEKTKKSTTKKTKTATE